jgi:aminopeptidase N
MLVVARRPAFVRRALRDDPTNFSDVPGFFLAHELAHQWWGHGVAGQNYRERWLSEGFAQYAAALWTQRAHGEEEFQGVLNRMGRWAMRKSEWGPISLGYRLGHIKGDAEAFRALVYDKAAYVLHMLRGLIGAEAFGAALIDVQSRFRYQKAGTDDVREAFERAADRPLAGYFQQWIYGTAVPELSFAQRSQRVDGVYRVVIDVKARELAGPLPLQLTVFHPGGRVNRRVTLPAEGGSFTLDSKERPIRVEINADRGLLAKVEGP